jgi:hypothetical protein
VPAVRYAFFLLLGVMLIVPLWSVNYPPLVDYPDHLARAFVLHHLHDANRIFSDWYSADWGPNPYLVVDSLLQVLQYPFDIYVAGRMVLTLCVLAIPLATWFFLRKASPGNEWLALWSLVVAYDTNFLMGFLSFQLSVALCLVVVAVWLTYLHNNKLSTWFALLLLTTLLYFTHIGGFAIAGVVLVLFTWIKQRFVDVFRAAALFVPGVACFLYVKLHSWAGRGFDYSSWHFSAKLVSLTTPFRGYSRVLDAVSLLVLACCLLLAFRKDPQAKVSRTWLIVSGAILLVHWIVPDRYGDLASIDTRFPPFAFLLALAIPSFGQRRKAILIYGATAVFLLRMAYITVHFHSEQAKLDTLAAGFATVPVEARVLACVEPPTTHGLWVWHSEIHFWAYGVITRSWVSPSLFHQRGVQPLTLRKAVYLGDRVDGGCAIGRELDWQRFRDQYDSVWAYDLPSLAPSLGTPTYTADKLVIYQVRRAEFLSGGNN